MPKRKHEDDLNTYAIGDYLNKSNLLIGSKYKSSLTELKVTYAYMFELQRGNYHEESDGVYVSLTRAQLSKLIDNTSGSFYNNLSNLASNMTSRSIGVESPETEHFMYITLVNKAEYKDGVFTVRFAKEFKPLITSLQGSFTRLNRATIMSLKSGYAFRLYELLRKSAYYPKTYTGPKNGLFLVEMGLAELKLSIGVVNAELDAVRKVLNNSKTPDYEKAVAASPERMYENWNDLKKRVLTPAIKEINEKADIIIELYDTRRSHRGGKIDGVVFRIQLKEYLSADAASTPVTLDDNGEIKSALTDSELFVFHMEVYNLFAGSNIVLSYEDVQAISEASCYDANKIKKAAKLMSDSGASIKNVTGWIIAAIKNEYEEPVKKGKTAKTNSFNDFDQRAYDYDAMENAAIDITNIEMLQ